jgi:hypothetical protein
MPIPHELRESLREVLDLIKHAKRDPDIDLDYDDAIQVGTVCGGRYRKKARPYVLTYHPEGDTRRGRWFLTLHQTEIEDIADGHMTELAMFCCVSPDCRTKFREADDLCFFCDYDEDEATRLLKTNLEALAKEVTTKEEWVAAYLCEKPNATATSLVGDYNPIEGLGKRLGYFTFDEAEELIQKVRERP